MTVMSFLFVYNMVLCFQSGGASLYFLTVVTVFVQVVIHTIKIILSELALYEMSRVFLVIDVIRVRKEVERGYVHYVVKIDGSW